MHWNIAQTRKVHSSKVAEDSDSPSLIGRTAVLARLLASDAKLLVLAGEPGIGKSRILAELRRGATTSTGQHVIVNCLQANQAMPFEPLTALARGLKRRGCVADEHLRNFVEARGHDHVWYFRELVEAAVNDGPLTLQIDDAHWADSESIEAVLCAIDRLQHLAVRWQLAIRSGHAPLDAVFGKLSATGVAHVERLDGLTHDETLELARTLVPPEFRTRLQAGQLWEHSGGNPLYVEYCVNAAASGKPATRGSLRQLFEERIAAISAASTDICSWLAVSGRPLAKATLAALTGLSVGGVGLLLEELEGSGLVVIGPDGPTFRHALIREACYGLLDDSERRRRHNALVPYADNDWHRVLHLDGSSQLAEAAATYNRLGWRHIDAAEPERALVAFDNALERVPAADDLAVEARAGHAIALIWLGRTADAMRAWQDFRHSRTSPTDLMSVTANVRLAEAAWENGEDVETALPVLHAALGSAANLAPHLLPRILLLLGAIHERRDELPAAQSYLERGLKAAESVANARDSLRLRSWLAVVKARLGDPAGGTAMLKAVVERAEALQFPNDVAQACVKLCYLADMAGDYDQYAAWCRRGLRDNGPASTYLRGLLMTNLASVETDIGDLRSALSHSEAAERLTSTVGGNLVGRALCQQAMLHAMMGALNAATECLARAGRQRLSESWRRAVEYARGCVAEQRGEFAAARDNYSAALPELNGSAITEVFELRALTGMVRTACSVGDIDDARLQLSLMRNSCSGSWTISESLLAEAEGHLALAEGNIVAGCAHLTRAQETARHRVRQLVLSAVVAEAQLDRRTLTSCIASLEQIEANALAGILRTRARALGMRPGRCHLHPSVLTEREIDVARHVASGKTNGEIAQTINVTRRTVEFHVANIFRKLDLNSRVELTALLASGSLSGAEMIKP